MSLYTTLLASPLAKMYPADKANHNMRGSWVAMLAAILAGAGAFLAYRPAIPPTRFLVALLVLSAIVGALCAFVVGKFKEAMDQRANDAAHADWLETDQSKPFVAPHGVEVADWQFTAWGAAPVCLPLLAAAVAAALML